MALEPVHFEATRTIPFKSEDRERYENGGYRNCPDLYIATSSGPRGYGFSECFVGQQYLKPLGYQWIHRAYNFIGGTSQQILDKWRGDLPDPMPVMREYLNRQGRDGAAILRKASGLDDQNKRIWHLPALAEEPDLFVFTPDGQDVRFVECKLESKRGRDHLSTNQIRTLAFLSVIFQCPVEIYRVVEEGLNAGKDPVFPLYRFTPEEEKWLIDNDLI